MAIQQVGLGEDSILLVDEVEYGLEPHRIRRLLKKLSDEHEPEPGGNGDSESEQGQVMMTTHSPTAVMAITVSHLRFVQCNDGDITVRQVESGAEEAVQGIIRRLGHAVLGKKLLVCEGKTEEALCRALDEKWTSEHDGESFAYCGVVPVDSSGTHGPTVAVEFRRLGYDVAYLGDSDAPLTVSQADMEAQGIKVVLWPGTMSTEQRIAADLSLGHLQEMIDVAVQIRGNKPILGAVGQKLGKPLVSVGPKIEDWISDGNSEHDVRIAIGEAAKSTLKGWFKDLNAGLALGQVVTRALPSIPESELARSLVEIEEWVYAE